MNLILLSLANEVDIRVRERKSTAQTFSMRVKKKIWGICIDLRWLRYIYVSYAKLLMYDFHTFKILFKKTLHTVPTYLSTEKKCVHDPYKFLLPRGAGAYPFFRPIAATTRRSWPLVFDVHDAVVW